VTSTVRRSDVEEALWKIAGRASWQDVEKVLRVVDAYAVTMARKLGPDTGEPRKGRLAAYYCKACDQRKQLQAFPEPKRRNPSLSYNCLTCQGVTGA
jgi:hypothetical protein